MAKNIFIYGSDTDTSKKTSFELKEKLRATDYEITDKIDGDTELIVCIGGDGTFLELIHVLDFPQVPIIGINTGHLGFFQEIQPESLDEFIKDYVAGRYSLQRMETVEAVVTHDGVKEKFRGLNEIVVASAANYAYSAHFDVSIGGSFIERFSGDGLIISTPAGSTAYNYSLGGSIVDPRLKLLQATPIAPMNTTAYRSFTSSIMLPPDLSLGIKPMLYGTKGAITIAYDGFSKKFDHADHIEVKLSDIGIELLRFASYDFWSKVKSKFL
ncbi:MAG: NAD(+)/NADH kinase [Eubacterium sp.]|jgi:NAD+ kinase